MVLGFKLRWRQFTILSINHKLTSSQGCVVMPDNVVAQSCFVAELLGAALQGAVIPDLLGALLVLLDMNIHTALRRKLGRTS